jgi:alkylation response protein AidB-like acyl-CoA dehydrogenase
MAYRAPVSDISFCLNHIAGFADHVDAGLFGDLDTDTAAAILEEAGRFATEELGPTNRSGDETAARLVDGEVRMPEGWVEVYRAFWESGWNSLPCPVDYGGQGLPTALAMAVTEMWNGANMAFGLNPLLTQAGVEAVHKYGSDELKAKYLPKMISGEWTGSMQLTEPHAGSDLRFMKARAESQPDGTFKITGTKIFITYGEHPLTDNIVHIVLARLPGAPEGTKGISMFLIPKFLVNDDRSLGGRNDVHCAKLEHKLGIHGSPTCVLNYGDKGGAIGWMIGEPNKGLHYMFTMMNQARLGVGVQAVGVAERAYQEALAYAQDRGQGARENTPPGQMTPIIHHPDVRRMLMGMKAKIAAARAICMMNAVAIDRAKFAGDDAERASAEALAALLTPVSKSYGSDIAVEVASEGIQVHGGMGFIEETGAAQHYRDARITPIYEGTNGIQAIDLVTRKLPAHDGEMITAFIADLRETIESIRAANQPIFGATAERLAAAVDDLEETGRWLLNKLEDDRDAALSGATSYCRLFANAAGGVYLARGALAALRSGDGGGDHQPHITIARHFAETQAPLTAGLKHAVMSAHETLRGESADRIFG